jgi:hypothetical protein
VLPSAQGPACSGRVYYSTEKSGQREDGLRLEHPFAVLDEYKLFEALLSNRKRSRAPDTPYVSQIKRLRERDGQKIRERRSGLSSGFRKLDGDMLKAKNPSSSSSVSSQSLDSDVDTVEKMKRLMHNSAITSHDLDGFLKIKCPADLNISSTKRWLVTMLTSMIGESTKRTLPAMIDLLSTYWTLGFEEGLEFNEREAYALTCALFQRALVVYKPTEYTVRNQEVAAHYGLDDIDVFRHFLDAYVDSFEGEAAVVNKQEKRQVLHDLLFRLAAQSGRIDIADAILSDLLQRSLAPSPDSIDVLIVSLSKHINAQRQIFPGTDEEFASVIKHDLVAYRALLISENVSPSVVDFLLSWAESPDEVYSILEISANARQSDKILHQCQVPILNAVVRCALLDGGNGTTPIHVRAMAHMFGVLNRFTNCNAGITADAYDQCLLLSAVYGNSAGMYRSLSMRQELQEESDIPNEILAQVLDHLPATARHDGAVVVETKKSEYWWFSNDLIRGSESLDHAVLNHLRKMIQSPKNADVYRRYVGALGRFKYSDSLRHEWDQVLQTESPDVLSQDVILEFLSAFRVCEAYQDGLAVLDSVLTNTHRGKAMSVLRRVFQHEILPLEETLRFSASWFIRHKEQSQQWPVADIQKIFDEITAPENHPRFSPHEISLIASVSKSISELVIQVRQGFDVQTSVNTLNDILQPK